jgi:redox-sensitive bicupin YhaK (pirin superfamily)
MNRTVIEKIQARRASDGDGVKLLRVFGGARPERFDPFLMLDEFGSNEASDYIGGFPPHPHRGFETITYMLQGKMEHRDHMENVGLINDGDVQWMTAGRGVIHSEMPRQTEGLMRGFQLWLNLPAKTKMQAARYQDVPAQDIPMYQLQSAWIKAIAGKLEIEDQAITGFFDVDDTKPVVLDIHLNAGATLELPIDSSLNALIYSYEGSLAIGDNSVPVNSQELARLSEGEAVQLANNSDTLSRFLLMAGKPLKESIVQHGPFVMNSHQEIEQAIRDYQSGALTA